jgi:O-acetyl-ADP-ribose deacetylase (regulator of RNase III)
MQLPHNGSEADILVRNEPDATLKEPKIGTKDLSDLKPLEKILYYNQEIDRLRQEQPHDYQELIRSLEHVRSQEKISLVKARKMTLYAIKKFVNSSQIDTFASSTTKALPSATKSESPAKPIKEASVSPPSTFCPIPKSQRGIKLSNEVSIILKDKNLHIIDSGATYIVNPVKKDLTPADREAWQLDQALEKEGQQARQFFVNIFKKMNGSLSVGQNSLVIPPGKLKAKGTLGIIDIAGPDLRIKEERKECLDLIKHTYITALNTAIRANANHSKRVIRIAFPAISAGIFKYDPAEYLPEVIREIEKWAQWRDTNEPMIKPRVIIEFYPGEHYSAFEEVIKTLKTS